MKYRYIILQPDEDGNIVHFLTGKGLQEILDDPIGYCGVEEFLEEKDLEDNLDPQYWKESQALIIEIKSYMRFKSVTTSYREKRDHEE